MLKKIKILSETPVFQGYTKVYEAKIQENGNSVYTREKVLRPDAAVGLIYNTETESVVLIKQFRYPTFSETNDGYLIEAIAGVVDKGENPKQTFIRESFEEAGYKLEEKDVVFCFSCFATPGYSTEKLHYFLATATNTNKIKNAGGGLESENENIEVVEIHKTQFKIMINSFQDSKTKLLALEAYCRNFF